MRATFRVFAPSLALLIASSAYAQRLPGAAPYNPVQQGVDRRNYIQSVLHEHEALMRRWMSAWEAGDARAAGNAYAEAARIVFVGSDTVLSRPAIERWLTNRVKDIAEVRTALTDFDASGGLAYAYGTYEVERRGAASDAPPDATGRYVAVLTMERGHWKYLLQLFVPDSLPRGAPAHALEAPAAGSSGSSTGNGT
jgi:ketosteroid isomerase-like protein